MTEEQYIHLITAYIEGTITAEEQSRLHDLIDRGKIDILDVKEMEILYRNLGKLPIAEPGEALRDRFYDMLEQEKEWLSPSFGNTIRQLIDQLRTSFQLKQVAFAIGIFLAGMLIGNWSTPFQDYRQQLNQLSGEVSQMREIMMLSLLDNESVSERLKAVNISTEIQTSDNKIAEALLKTLQNDPNVNVRLAAIESLVRHASNPLVREGLVDAITRQESPIIQAALADAMLTLQEKRSVEKFKELLDQNGLDKNVRNKLQNTIAALS